MFRLRLGLTGLAVLLLGGWLMGQDKKPADPPARVSLPTHYKKLGLSDDQLQAVRKIRVEYGTKIAKLRQEIVEAQKEERTKLVQVLTPEQRARLRDLRAGEAATKDAKPPVKDKSPTKDK
jgi:hypothetical protein